MLPSKKYEPLVSPVVPCWKSIADDKPHTWGSQCYAWNEIFSGKGLCCSRPTVRLGLIGVIGRDSACAVHIVEKSQ